MEQIPLDLEPEEPTLESLSTKELAALYKEKVGVNSRTFSREQMIEAIKNPEAEKDRLREIDRESGQEDLVAPYRR